MNKIKDMLRGPKPAEAHLWLLFAVFAAVLTLKNLMATTIISHFLPPSEFSNVALFLLQFMPSLLPAMLLASLVFVLKHKWWTVVINVLVDLWAVTNVIYSRANGQLIDIATILLAGNMDGTWKSLITYSHADMLLFPLLTALYVGVLIFCKRRFTPPQWIASRSLKGFLIALLLCLLLAPHRWVNDHYRAHSFTPLSVEKNLPFITTFDPLYGSRSFIHFRIHSSLYDPLLFVLESYSIIAYLPMTIADYFYYKIIGTESSLSSDETDELATHGIIQTDGRTRIHNKNKTIILLVESLESWPIGQNDNSGMPITPCLNQLVEDDNTAFFPNVRSQAAHGASGDGQMIVTSGLLPIEHGVACMRYPHQPFPSLPKMSGRSTIVNPWPGIWGQNNMNIAYGYSNSRKPSKKGDWQDMDVMCVALEEARTNDFVMALTLSTHTPFEKGKDGPLHFSKQMSNSLRLYLNALHYADSCIGWLTAALAADTTLAGTTLVITGDHTIFKENMMQEFQPFRQSDHLDLPYGEGFVPLIIHSPKVNHATYTDTVYQMDIFPTIQTLLDTSDYWWHGFGVDVLNDSARHHRAMPIVRASRLSNKIIVSGFLNQHQ